ncbi:alpha/beta fold hydrolase [Variovorax sp. KK3]|uniref:alpha/beta fold hydrolase n=1 Tax=Variovorax sp. KK3 TaxID=1855728 RepID=UPI00097C7CA2|nr:alpha/beta fold hydrolase [Variovorax sp. KK3]
MTPWIRHAAALAAFVTALAAHAAGTVGTTLPAGFPSIEDTSLGRPLIGFGAAGAVRRTPVIFIHGNNDSPFATACNPYGRVQAMAQHFADNGYDTSELWGVGYQGDQCDLAGDQTRRSSIAHTNAANVPDLRRFVRAVLEFTGAKRVDIVGHSLGVTLAREWMRQDEAQHLVRRFVAIDGPNHGIINCSPDPGNYYQAPAAGGFTPQSEVCVELGSPNTPFLRLLNGRNGRDETDGPTRVLVIRNGDASFVYFPVQDGVVAPVPAVDSFGKPTDFSRSASLRGAREIVLTGQGAYDPILRSGHLGILNSPQTWRAAFEFLDERRGRGKGDED